MSLSSFEIICEPCLRRLRMQIERKKKKIWRQIKAKSKRNQGLIRLAQISVNFIVAKLFILEDFFQVVFTYDKIIFLLLIPIIIVL